MCLSFLPGVDGGGYYIKVARGIPSVSLFYANMFWNT